MRNIYRFLPVLFSLVAVTACSGGAGDCDQEPIETETGLVIENLECGDGDEAQRGTIVTVNYTGEVEDGGVFDTTEGGQPATFPLGSGQLIQGWEEGIPGMREGGTRRLMIPPELGYGEAGSPPDIPPNATLVFEIELVEVTEP